MNNLHEHKRPPLGHTRVFIPSTAAAAKVPLSLMEGQRDREMKRWRDRGTEKQGRRDREERQRDGETEGGGTERRLHRLVVFGLML